MKMLFSEPLVLMLLGSISLAKSVRVNGYVRHSIGTYVYSYHRTSPDRSKLNNWSTKGNTNPYTGKMKTVTIAGEIYEPVN